MRLAAHALHAYAAGGTAKRKIKRRWDCYQTETLWLISWSALVEHRLHRGRTQGAHGEGDHGWQRLIRHEEAGQVQHGAVAAERDAEVRVCTQGLQ